MNLPLIIDNIIPKGYQDALESDMMQSRFPWGFIEDVTYEGYNNNSGLVHIAYDLGNDPSDYFSFIKPLVYHLEQAVEQPIKKLLRIRIGFLYPRNIPSTHNTPHVDFLYPHFTACYYVNDSDGDTVLFDKHIQDIGKEINNQALIDFTEKTKFNEVARCSPRKGTAFIIDGSQFHASTSPKINSRRLVVTVNWI
jgi:hypothetical protein